MPSATRILLVDDHAFFRAAIRALLTTEADFEIVGEVADGPDAVRLAAELSPDVVVMDVEMPGAFDGVEATRRILAAGHRSLVVGMSSSESYEGAMRTAGAASFLPKVCAVDLVDVIRAARRA